MIAYAIYFTSACFGAALLMNLWQIATAEGIGVMDRIPR